MEKIDKYIIKNTLSIIVKPNSNENKIISFDENKKALKVLIKAPAENNKANIEVIKYFSKLTGKNIKIIKGLKSKNKMLKLI